MGHLSPPVTLTSRLGGSTRHLHSTLLLFYIVRLWWAPKLGQTHLIILLWSVPEFLFHAFPPPCFRRVETWLSLTFDQGCCRYLKCLDLLSGHGVCLYPGTPPFRTRKFQLPLDEQQMQSNNVTATGTSWPDAGCLSQNPSTHMSWHMYTHTHMYTYVYNKLVDI